jgi:hypothetical protein
MFTSMMGLGYLLADSNNALGFGKQEPQFVSAFGLLDVIHKSTILMRFCCIIQVAFHASCGVRFLPSLGGQNPTTRIK